MRTIPRRFVCFVALACAGCLVCPGEQLCAQSRPSSAPRTAIPSPVAEQPADWRSPREEDPGAKVGATIRRKDGTTGAAPSGSTTGSGSPRSTAPTADPGSAGRAGTRSRFEPGPGDGDYRDAEPVRVGRTGRDAPADSNGRPAGNLEPIARPTRKSVTRVSQGTGALPNQDGQVWREYDITPYTQRVTSTKRPEQSILDWVFRETGYETWHSDIVTVLAADQRTLKVYHTPEVQEVIGELVDRFTSRQTDAHLFGLRVVTIGKPDWRARAQRILRPLQVETAGVQAWLLRREDASLLMAELSKRIDFREHSTPQLMVSNGQSISVVATQPRRYVQGFYSQAEAWPQIQQQLGSVEEGFSLELSPLLSLDGQAIDAAIKCNIDQIEKLHPVIMEMPSTAGPMQRSQIDVPQISQFRLHERFRWPVDQVLLVSLGMVPHPQPTASKAGFFGIGGAARCDLLIFVDGRGVYQPTTPGGAAPAAAAPATATAAGVSQGRY